MVRGLLEKRKMIDSTSLGAFGDGLSHPLSKATGSAAQIAAQTYGTWLSVESAPG